ncbi:MAG: methionyl-tRNA formyltransferase [Phototrophicales bacterium]|nr:MAG: methionyl-tRNA formyltransferase [Phototrophicales bacterium]
MARIIFMGTPDFAVQTLQALITHHDVIGVITQPDRPAGRKQRIRESPVKQVALAHDIPIFQPQRLRKAETIAELRAWQPDTPDVYVVAAFGQILPQEVLDIPHHGSLNVHASLLPRWRGAAPIQAAIRAGDSESGVTIMKMDAGLDTGPMLAQRAIPLAPDETGQSLHDKLATLGAELLLETLPGYLAGDITPQPQDDSLATLAPQIKKEEGHIDWSQSAASIERLVRAFTPWPGTYTFWDGTQLKILRGEVGDGHADAGVVIERDERIAIGTGEGLYYPQEVQLAGKKAVDIEAFLRGHQTFIGARLG